MTELEHAYNQVWYIEENHYVDCFEKDVDAVCNNPLDQFYEAENKWIAEQKQLQKFNEYTGKRFSKRNKNEEFVAEVQKYMDGWDAKLNDEKIEFEARNTSLEPGLLGWGGVKGEGGKRKSSRRKNKKSKAKKNKKTRRQRRR